MMQKTLSVGIYMTEAGAEAALVRNRRSKTSVLGVHFATFPEPALDPVDQGVLEETFIDLARNLPTSARRPDVPVMISLPDPFIREDVLEFEDFPVDDREALQLVRLRIARETWADADALACSFQRLATGVSGMQVLIRTMPLALRDAVERTAMAAGFQVALIEGWSHFALHGLALIAPPQDGAFFWSDGRAWSLQCWSAAHPEGFSESGWLGADDTDAAMQKARRLVRSFQMAQSLGGLQFRVEAPGALFDALQNAGEGIETLHADLPDVATQPAERVALWR